MMHSSVTQHMTIHAHRCLNARGVTDFCQACLDGCPQNAIELTGNGIRLDATRCNECALCTDDCPTEVFSHDGFSPIDFVNLAEGKKELGLRCQLADGNSAKSDAQTIPCHGLLNESLLLGLRSVGVENVHVDGLDGCVDCPSRVGAKRLRQTLKNAPPALKARFPSLHDASRTTDDFPDVPEKPMDRRGFLDASVNAVTFAALSALPTGLLRKQEMLSAVTEPGKDARKAKHVPQYHRLALLSLHGGHLSSADAGDSPAWFHEVRAQGNCDACGVCSLTCPTGALFSVTSEHSLRLDHQPDKCIGCGLCITTCPQQALRLDPVHDDATILDDRTLALFECERLKCRTCDTHFIAHAGHAGLCLSCENEREIHAQWIAE